jgi:hypothetical protein
MRSTVDSKRRRYKRKRFRFRSVSNQIVNAHRCPGAQCIDGWQPVTERCCVDSLHQRINVVVLSNIG